MEELVSVVTSEAMKLPPTEAAQFAGAVEEGILAITEGDIQNPPHRFILDFALVLMWKRVEQFRTSTELYDFLGGAKNRSGGWLGDIESFQRYLRELEIRIGKRGRPGKPEPQPNTTS